METGKHHFHSKLTISTLPNNKEQCLKRLLSLKRKLLKNDTVKKEYTEIMQKIFERGHATCVPQEQLETEPKQGVVPSTFRCASS